MTQSPDSDPHHAALRRLRHDLLTPLNGVAGYLAIVDEDARRLERYDLLVAVRPLRQAAADIIEAIGSMVQPGPPAADVEEEVADLALMLRGRCLEPVRGIAREAELLSREADDDRTPLASDLRCVADSAAALVAMLDQVPALYAAARPPAAGE